MSIHVLIADDHPMLRAGMRTLLEMESDFSVCGEATDGEEAVELAKQLQPDIIIMDVMMPRVNGIEATRLIKQANPKTAVLVLTAFSDISFIINLLEAGASGYLLKDASGNEIVRAIRSVYNGEAVLDQEISQKLVARVVQTRDANHHPAVLTARETEILQLAAQGMSNKDIANQLFLSLRTVKAHMTNIFDKLGCGSRTDAIIKGLKEGFVSLDEVPRVG